MIDLEHIARLTEAQRRVLAIRLRLRSQVSTSTGPRLVAYVQSAPEDRPEPTELRRHLAAQLPDYMIPSEWVFLPALPRLPSGKLDHQALRALNRAASRTPEPVFEPPTDELEQNIARVWGELLGREGIGVQENFFDLGGHSLLLVRLQNRLREAIGLEVTVMDLFRYPTIKAIANAARANGTRAAMPSRRLEAARERVLKHRQALRRPGPHNNGENHL